MTRVSLIASVLVLLLSGLLVSIATLGPIPAAAGNRWPIEWIEVQGEFERVSAEQVRAAAVPLLDDGFFAVDLERIRARVEGLPWIRAAEVRKVWPDQLLVRVREHEPVARWNGPQLLSDLGEVFSVEGMISVEGLPRLSGPEGAEAQVLDFLRALRGQLSGTGLDVLALQRSARGGWSAELSGGLLLVIGRDEPINRIQRLVNVLEDLRADPARRPVAIDLRYTNGFAVQWRESEFELLPVSDDGGVHP